MIKNLLYSILLHLFVICLVYLGVKDIEIVNSIDIKGVSVSIANIIKKDEVKIEENQEKIKEKNPKKEFKKAEPIKKKKPKIKKKVEKKKKNIVKKKKIIKKPKKAPEKTELKPDILEESDIKKELESEEIIDDLEKINLSPRQKFNIQSQLNGCFYRVFKDYKNISEIEVILNLNKDGSIFFDRKANVNLEKYNDKNDDSYKKMIDNVEKAVKLCSPFRNLPSEKYEIWQKFKIKFVKNAKKQSKNDKNG